jgi:hypothetical protein
MKSKRVFSLIMMGILIICSSANVYAYETDIDPYKPYNNDIILYGTKPPTKSKNLAGGSVDFDGTFCYQVYSEYNFITSTGKINMNLKASHDLYSDRELSIALFDENQKKVDEKIIELSDTGRTISTSITFRNLSTTKKYYIRWAGGDLCNVDDYISVWGKITE